MKRIFLALHDSIVMFIGEIHCSSRRKHRVATVTCKANIGGVEPRLSCSCHRIDELLGDFMKLLFSKFSIKYYLVFLFFSFSV